MYLLNFAFRRESIFFFYLFIYSCECLNYLNCIRTAHISLKLYLGQKIDSPLFVREGFQLEMRRLKRTFVTFVYLINVYVINT